MSESHFLASDVEQHYLKEVATLRARAERAEAENKLGDAMLDTANASLAKEHEMRCKLEDELEHSVRTTTMLDHLLSKERQANAAAQSTIAELEATVERLREAIEKAPHALYCWASYNDCGWPRKALSPEKCDCWKRAALGGDS